MRFRIHEDLERGIGARRRQEWALALRDLEHGAPPGEDTLTLHPHAEGGLMVLVAQPGVAPGVCALPEALLRPHLQAYTDLLVFMTDARNGEGSRSFEALDYAKKLAHDEAGEMLMEALEPHVPLDLATARRLFTLIFLLLSPLPEAMVTRHRIHR